MKSNNIKYRLLLIIIFICIIGGVAYFIKCNEFTAVYITVIILLMILAAGTILFFNVKAIHNSMFILIMILGIMSSILNPVLDIPDEHDHISRADLASRGYFIMGEDYKDYRLSNTVGCIIHNNWSTFNHTPLTDTKPDWSTESTYYSYANANLFIGYIPQTIGIMLSKVFAPNDYIVFLFGRIMNVIMYAIVVRYALKKTPIYKVPLAIVSILPISLFIVGSYNADATTYAFGILAISYFLYLYEKQDISVKDMSIYFIICTVLGVVKLPYCLLIGLLLFIPKDKYRSSKDYYKSIIFILITAIIALGWAGISVMRTEYSPFQSYFDKNGVNSREQVKFILSSPIIFIKGFVVSLVKNIPGYVSQLNQFGWLTYSMPRALTYLLNTFLVVVLIGYPSQSKLTKKTNIGVLLVSLGVYVATCFTLYITWTTVGADFILGVQGRYFVPVIGLLSLLWPYRIKCKENKKEFVDYIFMCVSVLFAIIYLIVVTNQYY